MRVPIVPIEINSDTVEKVAGLITPTSRILSGEVLDRRIVWKKFASLVLVDRASFESKADTDVFTLVLHPFECITGAEMSYEINGEFILYHQESKPDGKLPLLDQEKRNVFVPSSSGLDEPLRGLIEDTCASFNKKCKGEGLYISGEDVDKIFQVIIANLCSPK